MSTVKDPAEKKRLELSKDNRTFSEGKKIFRRGWRTKKSNASKAFRRRTNAAIGSIHADAGQSERVSGRIAPPRKHLKKRGVVTLDVALRLKGPRRGERFSDFNYLSQKFVRAKREKP